MYSTLYKCKCNACSEKCNLLYIVPTNVYFYNCYELELGFSILFFCVNEAL